MTKPLKVPHCPPLVCSNSSPSYEMLVVRVTDKEFNAETASSNNETVTEPSSQTPDNSMNGNNTNGDNPSAPGAGSEDEQRVDSKLVPCSSCNVVTDTVEDVFAVTIKLPHHPYKFSVMVSTQEQVQDLRQSIMESPGGFQYSCFHLQHEGQRINDFVELSAVEGLVADSELNLVEDPYTEKDARLHLLRTREIIGAAGERTDSVCGLSAGLSLHDSVCPWKPSEGTPQTNGTAGTNSVNGDLHALDEFQFDEPPILGNILPSKQDPSPKTIKSIALSPWNPPPQFLRQKGHLLYIQLTTNEGEQFQITAHNSGFFVNKSSNSKFDPFPKVSAKTTSAHSLFTLISYLSPSFMTSFESLQEANSTRDPLSSFQLTNAIPSSPWQVAISDVSLPHHQSDLTRTQETYLLAGADNTETLRDWNEEIQNTKEMPKESVQDRIFRERLLSKIYAEFNDAAVRGAVLVARGEVPALNPTETRNAQIFIWNNVFYSFGADGVGTFTSEGGDEAARVAVGKDVAGVRSINQLDIDKLATAATIIVDYLGKRIVAQSIVPGIFKQREPEEHQVDYGGVEGRDIVAENQDFVPMFSQVSKALRVKRHPVWDKEGKEHMLEASVETKGLLGTDGRKYILDLYRLTPLDVLWLEEHGNEDFQAKNSQTSQRYPHRMTVLRPELVETYWRLKLGEYVKEQVENRKATSLEAKDSSDELANGTAGKDHSTPSRDGNDEKTLSNEDAVASNDQEHVDISAFTLTLNPDVYCGQMPQTDLQKAEWAKDEDDVRKVCQYLHDKVLPDTLHDLKEGEVGFPMDGESLSGLLHKRGVNLRYLGKLATLADQENPRLQALRALAHQEMIARAFKHIINRYLKDVPILFATSCYAHLLNCLLGSEINACPKVDLNEDYLALYPEGNYSFADVTSKDLHAAVEHQVQVRYRFQLPENWAKEIKHVQLLRNISLKLGIQLVEKSYQFLPLPLSHEERTAPSLDHKAAESELNGLVNGKETTNGNVRHGKKKKKNAGRSSPTPSSGSDKAPPASIFTPDDIANVMPVVRDACPKSRLAEEAFEAGKISMMQGQKEVGSELLLESLTLHEQIYGILHPEVARVYHQLAMLYFQLDEKNAAVELAHKAVIISERTIGIDSSETVLAYMNLALFEHGNRNTMVALRCLRHALELWKIIYGPSHPDSITTLNNAAVMLQQLQLYKASRLWFEKSLSISEGVSGKQSVNTATLLFQLAQALVLDGDHKGAVNRMREAYSIFLAKLGKEDTNTKESEKWLEQLTQNAVSMAKHAKDVQARRNRRTMLNPRSSTLAAHPQPQVGQSPAAAGLLNGNDVLRSSGGGGAGGLDARSIDELIKFIEGGSQSPRKATPKKRSLASRQHPRHRSSGSTVGATA